MSEGTAPESESQPRITAMTKTKNPNRVAQGKKLAAIRAEKRRLRELEASEDPQDPEEHRDDDDGYKKATFCLTLVSAVAALLSIPFVYRYLTREGTPEEGLTIKPAGRSASPMSATHGKEPSKPTKPVKPASVEPMKPTGLVAKPPSTPVNYPRNLDGSNKRPSADMIELD